MSYEKYRLVTRSDFDGLVCAVLLNEINLIDVIKSDTKDMDEEINTQNNIELLLKFLNVLNPREKEIIIKRYGLYNTKEETQKEMFII